MMKLKPGCECCDVDLPPDSAVARICTYECTYCATCADEMDGICKNCGGNLVERPVRPASHLVDNPASTERIFNPHNCPVHNPAIAPTTEQGTAMPPTATSLVTETTGADPAVAFAHFAQLLSLETDCWDVHQDLSDGICDFVLLDVRGRGGFDAGHIAGATHFPHPDLTEAGLSAYPMETLFVVYCAGPHCNGADKAAVQLSRLGRPVKKMIGGVEGWKDEGFDLVSQ